MSVVTFDPDTHTYQVDGVYYPGITQVLKDVGLLDTSHYPAGAAMRGTSVHEAINLIEQGVLDAGSFAGSEIEGDIRAWVAFKAAAHPKILYSERLAAEETLHYATHIDLVIESAGKEAIVDVKTGDLKAWHGLQLAGCTTLTGIQDRFVLQLSKDGSFKCHYGWKGEKFSSRVWDKAWISAVTLYWFKRSIAA